MHSSRMRTGRSLTVCRSLLLGKGGGAGSDCPQFPPLGVGLDLIALNFPLGCGPRSDRPQFSPLGVGLDLIALNFHLGCGPGGGGSP